MTFPKALRTVLACREGARRAGAWRERKVYGRPWQDWLFSFAGVVFIAGLLPMLWHGIDVPLATGLSTSAMLYALAVAQASYRNWMAVAVEITAASIWLLLGLGT